ncbi:MAG: hypothetical protein ABSF98_23595 [Bryobacteraceae bacterium]|jgi:hypothetical protein
MSYIEYITHDAQANDPLPEFARTTGFTMPDLEENRKGRISNPQMVRLLGRALRPVRYTASATIVWLVIVYAIRTWFPGIVSWIAKLCGVPVGSVLSIVTICCAGAVALSILRSAHTIGLLIIDLAAGQATFKDGRVVVSREEENGLAMAGLWGEKRMKCFFVMAGEYFEVGQEACEAPPEGRCRLYHTPKSKMMLAIEPVPLT